MAAGETVNHPWMANSVAAIKARMLAEIGAASIEELFEQIPAEHRLNAARSTCRRACARRPSCAGI